MTTCFITNNTITTVINGVSKITDLDSDLGKVLLEAYKKDETHLMFDLIEAHKIIDNQRIKDDGQGDLLVDGVHVDSELAFKIREIKAQGLPYDNLLRFAEKVKDNPSFNSRKMLYKFLMHNGHPICKNGNFIAYKKVTNDFKDLRTRNFDNSIGSIVTMDRNNVDDNPNNTCSSGLHVASFKYAKDFGSGKLVMVEVDPKDVVAVPKDYDGTKMRTCRYTVICVTEESIKGVYFNDELKIGDCFVLLDSVTDAWGDYVGYDKLHVTDVISGSIGVIDVDGNDYDILLEDIENNYKRVD